MKNKKVVLVKIVCFSLIIVGLSSCQFFETEKISSETFLEEEIKSISWNEVDSYPTFKECEGVSGKLETKSCFETTLIQHLQQSIHSENTIVTTDLNQTVLIDFAVNEKAKLLVTAMKIDSILENQLPLLKQHILQSLDSIQPIAPAYKRGIPVKTTFKLPVVIKTNS